MNLADMLCYADIAELTRIANAYSCDCSGHSKNELIQSILATVQRRDVLEELVADMNGGDLRFLNSLLFESRSAYSLEELKARAEAGEQANAADKKTDNADTAKPAMKQGRSRKAKKAEKSPPPTPDEAARRAIVRFKSYGWLFNGFSQQTRYLYQVPEDIKSRLREALERRYRERLAYTDEPPAYRDERSLILDDLVCFLRFVRDNELPVTTEGVLYKRGLVQLLELFAVNEELPTRGGWRFGYGRHFRDYPDRFSLLYDFAYSQGYIAETPDRLTITENGLQLAAGQAPPDAAKLYQFWLRVYKGPIPNLTTLVQWVRRLSAEWVTVQSLYDVLQPLIRSYYYDSCRDIFERRVLAMLMHLGVVRWGTAAAGGNVVRMTPQGSALVAGTPLVYEDTIYLAKSPARDV